MRIEAAMCQRCGKWPRACYQHLRAGDKKYGPWWVCWACWPLAIPFLVDEAKLAGVPEEVEEKDTEPL